VLQLNARDQPLGRCLLSKYVLWKNGCLKKDGWQNHCRQNADGSYRMCHQGFERTDGLTSGMKLTWHI
jgi:hypothetical protein